MFIKRVHCTGDNLEAVLSDGRNVSKPLNWFPKLAAATPGDRNVWDFIAWGKAIHWPTIDEKVSLAELLSSEPPVRSPFTKGATLAAENEAKQLEAWRWVLAKMGGIKRLRAGPLALPTDFRPAIDERGHARPDRVLAIVRELMDLRQGRWKIVAQSLLPEVRAGDSVNLEFGGQVSFGAVAVEGDEMVVAYDGSLIVDPMGLITTLARELARFVILETGKVPGGADNEEFCTDIGVVCSGFGLLGATTAKRHFRGIQGGNNPKGVHLAQPQWTFGFGGGPSHGVLEMGALEPDEWAFALAVFFALRNQPIEAAKPWLSQTLMDSLERATRYLAQNPDKLAVLRVSPGDQT